MGRFQDNVTKLDAATLNGLEDDLKALSGIPVFTAEYDPIDTYYHWLKISDQSFIDSVKIGFTFIMIPKESTQGNSGKKIAIGRDGYGDPLFWNGKSESAMWGYEYATVNNTKYLQANRPYIIKCFDKVGENFQFLITEIFRDVPASETNIGGVKVWVDGSTLNISTT